MDMPTEHVQQNDNTFFSQLDDKMGINGPLPWQQLTKLNHCHLLVDVSLNVPQQMDFFVSPI